MKRILLASTAIVGLAGAAAAEVSWTGAAKLGYNDDIRDGVYADVDLDVTLSQELDNGLTAGATFGWELADDRGPANSVGNEYVSDNNVLVFLTHEMAGIYYGDTEFAAVTYWDGVTNMNEDNFSEQDGEDVLRGEVMYGGITAGISYGVDARGEAAGDELYQLSLGAKGEFGAFSFTAAYQEEELPVPAVAEGDFVGDEIFGVSVGTSFAGADVAVAYAANQTTDENSLGVELAYPIGPVTATVFYVAETAIDDSYGINVAYAAGPITANAFFHDGGDEDQGFNIGYDVGNGLGVYAGYSDDDGQYVAGVLDLGNGASLTAAYAEHDDNPLNDEIGPREYLHGTTVVLGFAF